MLMRRASSEKRCDSTDRPSCTPLNAEPVMCRLPVTAATPQSAGRCVMAAELSHLCRSEAVRTLGWQLTPRPIIANFAWRFEIAAVACAFAVRDLLCIDLMTPSAILILFVKYSSR